MESNKLTLLCILILFLSSIANAKSPLNIEGEEATSIGIYIANVKNGNVLLEYNSDKTFTPASIMKAVTTASALSTLGSEYQFKTNVFTTGKIDNNVLLGNILIEGVGDPTLESRHFPDNNGFIDSIISQLKKRKITRIKGSIIVEQSLIKDQGIVPKWEIEDVAWGYGAGYYALNFMDNTFNLYLPGMETVPHISGLKVLNNTTIGKNDPIMSRGIDSYTLNVSGTIPDRKSYSLSCATPEPSQVLIDSIYSKSSSNGIIIDNICMPTTNMDLLFRHKSPKAQDIMRSLMVRSDNLMAEGILRAIAPDSTRAAAIDTEIKLWDNRNINCDYISIYDGSGLSRSNRLSPKFMGNILSWMAKSDMIEKYVALFPKAGKEGTLRRFLANSRLSGKIVLKTGSMGGVQSYAGYKLNDDGEPEHVIVIMVNNFFCKRKALINEIERLLLKIF